MFKQTKCELIADIHTAVLLSRTSGTAQCWRSSSITVDRNDFNEVVSVSLSWAVREAALDSVDGCCIDRAGIEIHWEQESQQQRKNDVVGLLD
jgi:hypothetical protein